LLLEQRGYALPIALGLLQGRFGLIATRHDFGGIKTHDQFTGSDRLTEDHRQCRDTTAHLGFERARDLARTVPTTSSVLV
jgi:hypothetical protein